MSHSWFRLAALFGLVFVLCVVPSAQTRQEKGKKVEDDPEPPVGTVNSIGMKLTRIPAGKFMMGSPQNEASRSAREGPQHEVQFSKAFHMGVYEVTQAQYKKVIGKNPSKHQKGGDFAAKVVGMNTDDFPVEWVSWKEAVEFCKKLSDLPAEKKAGRTYRLPTEAEWEYACRAGTKTVYNLGDALTMKEANLSGSLGRTAKVGSYKPNKWGLYDMHGNVCEWCMDLYGENYYQNSPKKDPPGPQTGTGRVMRGGCLVYSPGSSRCAARDSGGESDHRVGTVGFRVVCIRR